MFGRREGLWVDIKGCVCLRGRGARPWRQTWKVMSSQVGFTACCNSWTPDRIDEKSRQWQLLARGLRYVKSQSYPEWWSRPLPLSLPSRQSHWCGYDFLSTLNLSELLFFKQITWEGFHLGYFQTLTLRRRKREWERERKRGKRCFWHSSLHDFVIKTLVFVSPGDTYRKKCIR